MRLAEFRMRGESPSVFASLIVCGLVCACSSSQLTSPRDVAGFNPSAQTSRNVEPPPSRVQEEPTVPVPPGPTDSQISAAVFRQLERDPGIDDRHVYVSTNDGIVQLTGVVHDILSKERVARVAGTVRGVRTVSDRVRLEIPKRDDVAITRELANALHRDPVTAPFHLRVAVRDRIVHLSGRATSFQQQTIAERLAKKIHGVRAVDDDIEVVSWIRRTDGMLTRDVESRLRWDPLVDHVQLSVETRDGIVFLRGQVGTFAEVARASSDAWVKGVRTVDSSGLGVNPGTANADLRAASAVGPSDGDIARAIRDATIYDPRVKSFQVESRVSGGNVTLLGIVDDHVAKDAADALARHTVGVLAVHNRIQVASEKPDTDRDKLERIESALAIDTITDRSGIGVEVAHNTAKLTGVVDSYMVRSEAEELAAGAGVGSVEDDLYVEESP